MSTLHDADNDAMFGRDLRVYPPKPNPMSEYTAAPPEHPSVAWWAACPWITDRPPTAADASENGYVLLVSGAGYALDVQWSHVLLGRSWIHPYGWRPKPLTLGERIDAELAANAELSPELRALLIEAKAVIGEVVK